MAQDITVFQHMGGMSTVFAPTEADFEDLGGGVVGAFAILKIKGKVFSVQHRGDRTNLVDEQGNALPSVEVAIIKSAPHLSKLFYKDGFDDRQSEGKRPDCWSNNGVTPDVLVPQPVNNICVNCPMNAFGSRQTEQGKNGKACSDHKRMVVVPLEDMENEYYGGPMLLRVPAASLGEASDYGIALKQMGYAYYAVGTRIRFDVNEAYPKLLFSPIRALTDDEAAIMKGLRDDPRTIRILNEEPEAPTPVEGQPMQFEQPPAAAAPTPVSKPAVAKPPAPRPAAPQPAPAPVAAAPKPAAQAPRPAPAPTPAAAAPRPFSGAPKPVATPTAGAPAPAPKAAGGFARPAGAIAAAVAQPAPRPATTRPVVKAAAAPPPPPPEQETGEEPDGGLPAGLDNELDALLQ